MEADDVEADDVELDADVRTPLGFLNSWLDGEMREDDGLSRTGAGDAGTPSIPISRFGCSSKCFTSE